MQPLRAGTIILNLVAIQSINLHASAEQVRILFAGREEETVYSGKDADAIRRAFNRCMPRDDSEESPKRPGLIVPGAIPIGRA